jgi:thiosulfate/3-mercaptopyruvate sulfurtransferase
MSDSTSSSSVFSTPLVETDWLGANLGASDLRIIDCSVVRKDQPDGTYTFVSGQENWEQGHIPGSMYVFVLGELSDPDHPVPMMMPSAEKFADIMAGYGVGDDTRVVLYDNSNHAWAARVWWMLRVCGFDNAAVLNGGWKKWCRENRTVSTEVVSYPRGNFIPRPRPELMAGKQEVLESLGSESVKLIHALPPDTFTGKAAPYGRPGRIPGSSNVYCEWLIDPEACTYIDVEAQRHLFEQAGALDADRVITYCGGGIAASSDALALVAVGVKNVAVYDGSLSEWAADPAMPMETG